MDRRLRFSSYNCKHLGVDKYIIIQSLLVACDFFMIQEHCMHGNQFVQTLRQLSPYSECVVTSAMDETVPLVGSAVSRQATWWLCNNLEYKYKLQCRRNQM